MSSPEFQAAIRFDRVHQWPGGGFGRWHCLHRHGNRFSRGVLRPESANRSRARAAECHQPIQSGSDVEYDPVNKLFLVAQSVSSTGSGSSIQVYNPQGKLIESLNGFNFSNASNVIGTHIALNPSNRSGYVDGPNSGVTDIQSFTY